METKPRIAILGAGPIGLEAALTAAEKGYPFNLYEAAPQIAGHVSGWGHVRLFTPWELNVSPRMRRALAEADRPVPEQNECPTGAELIEKALQPASQLAEIASRLRLGSEIRAIGRQGLLKHEEIGTSDRGRRPFRLLVADSEGRERFDSADVVLDCTGTSVPNTLGDGGIPALGESELNGAIWQEVPDIERNAADWQGRSILLVGSGHSAQTAVCALLRLAETSPGTRVLWALRRQEPHWQLIDDDPLPERHRLTATAAGLAADPPPALSLLTGVTTEAITASEGRFEVLLRRHDGSAESIEVDRILSLTGKVGDHRLYRQLQVHECYATSGPMQLAAALMGSEGGDCMQQTSQGPAALRNPEPGFFILGSKSYGRRTDFLMRVGWQQVDEVFQLLEE